MDGEYGAIIIPTGTFLLLHEREGSIAALKNFHKHLKHGGKLVVDLFLQTDITLGKASTRAWELDNGDVITLEDKTVQVDYINQFTVGHNRYGKWRNGTLIQSELEKFPLRWYGVEEFKMILEQAGFENIVISSGYEYGTYPETHSKPITYEATAKKF